MTKASQIWKHTFRASAFGAAVLLSSVALAAPAPAAQIEHFHGCRIAMAYRPAYSHHGAAGEKVYNHPYRITCNGGRKVIVEQEVYVDDWPFDWLRKRHTSGPYSFNHTNHERRFNYHFSHTSQHYTHGLIFHKIKIKVYKNDGSVSSWSEWSTSPGRSVIF